MSNVKKRRQADLARQRRVRLALTALVLALAAAAVLAVTLQKKPAALGRNDVLFELPDAQGKVTAVRSDGRPVVLELFATWCPYCAYESQYDLPAIRSFVEGQGARFIAVNATPYVGVAQAGPQGHPEQGQEGSRAPASSDKDIQAAVQEYAGRYHYDGPLFYDRDMKLATQLGLQAYPTFVILDGRGRVLDKHEGMISVQDFEAWYRATVGSGR
ncbi:MAG: TlpA family protein disulfide reductase [Firmicutes bacterium]|nr:TlpA family protein disulfide reductase [Bacillota bacterium]